MVKGYCVLCVRGGGFYSVNGDNIGYVDSALKYDLVEGVHFLCCFFVIQE